MSYSAPQMIQKNCAACGASISVRLADHKRGWGKFCDKACSGAYKCGQRPRDVNKYHAKFSSWAADRMEDLSRAGLSEWPKAPSIGSQLGGKAPKVKHKLHSPEPKRNCRDCGKPSGSEYRCDNCADHEAGIDAMEAGWDGHKHGD